MTITADTSITLDVNSPKKDAVVATGAPTVGDDDVAIWGNTLTDVSLTTQTIATYRTLFRAMMDNIKDGEIAAVASGPIDVSVQNVAFTAPNAGELGLYIGSYVADGDRSHFLDRTLKRLCEAWLELAKSGTT
jgi:hypothetical protein